MNPYNLVAANKRKTFLIFSVFLFIIVGFFYLLSTYTQNDGYIFLGFTFASFSSISSYFYSDKMVLWMNNARPADKNEFFDFYTVTENLAIAEGIPMPKLYVINDPAPNAFATGRNPKNAVVCATTGLLTNLERSEIEGVIAHELSHIKNYDILVMTIVAVLVGTVGYITQFSMRGMWGMRGQNNREERGNPLALLALFVGIIIMPLVATIIQLAISRKREYLADASGALLTRNPIGLASALEKISAYEAPMRNANSSTAHLFIANPFKKGYNGQWLGNLFSTHPPVEERIRILKSM